LCVSLCSLFAMNEASLKFNEVVGTALEFTEGRHYERKCYGSYAEDMPDQDFRFRIAFVQHEGDFKMHAHEYSELVFVMSGRATHVTEIEEHELENGDVFVISGDRKHGFRDAQGLSLCNIMFDPDQFLRGRKELEEMMGYQALFELQPRTRSVDRFQERLHLSPEDLAYATNLITNLKLEYGNQVEGRRLVITSGFHLLVAFVCRLYGREKKDTIVPLMQMAKVTSFIQKNFRDPIRVEDLADIANLSVSHLQRKFRKIYDTTPISYINKLRIHDACEMLKDESNSMTHIAYHCGFGSSSFFSRQFRQALGESPSAYRAKNQQN
jgi:AraC-like DNA-binding protein/mannose-6-phosphate isomerase-like protein (cupin superfamily)